MTDRITVIAIVLSTWMGNAQQPNAKLHQLFEEYYTRANALDPKMATLNGIHDHNDELPADDKAHLKKKHDFYKKTLRQLQVFANQPLNPEDRISYAILQEELDLALKLEKYHPEYMPITQLAGMPTQLAMFGSGNSAQPFKTVADYDNWLKRCKAFSRWTDVAIDNMRTGLRTGMVLPVPVVERVIPQMQALAGNVPESSFYAPTDKFPDGFSQEEQHRLSREFKDVIPTYVFGSMQKLADFFLSEYLPKARMTSGINALPNGAAMYRDYIFAKTTTHAKPAEIHQLGLLEVARITSEMEKIRASISFEGTLNELFVFMKTDSRFMPYRTDQEIIDAFHAIHETIRPNLPKFFGIAPETPFEIRKTEEYRAASASAQYIRGDLPGKRPGIFYFPILDPAKVNVTSTDMESLFLHEAIPGHHFQISIQYENTSAPRFRQKYSNSAFVEGWALYTESLGKDLGLYTNVYHQLGALGAEIHRAIRLVVDSGLHTGKMNRESAIKYMLEHEAIGEDKATAEIERYMAMPAQALSYKIGELKIKELRDKYAIQLGARFSIRDFHDTILKGGAMPLTVFEKYMDRWADSVR